MNNQSNPLQPMPQILTIPRAAALMGIPRTTLWGWVKALPEWRACISHCNGRRTYLSTARLRAAGHLEVA